MEKKVSVRVYLATAVDLEFKVDENESEEAILEYAEMNFENLATEENSVIPLIDMVVQENESVILGYEDCEEDEEDY